MDMKSGSQPLLSFITIVILGIIIAVRINHNQSWVAPIILFSIIIGFTLTIFELRIIGRQSLQGTSTASTMSNEERERRLAMMVSEAFKEDFPSEKSED